MADVKAIAERLSNEQHIGKDKDVKALVEQALAAGVDVEKVLNDGLVAGMQIVGDKFKNNVFYVPEVLISARAMNAAMTVLAPKLAASGHKPLARVVVGTVKGDLHDIGKNLVKMMLTGGGFEVIDLNIDVDPKRFVEEAKAKGAQLIACSALLTTTMPQMKNVVEALKAAQLKGVKVMIGGAPVTQEYCDEIGADGYAPDAASAVDLARSLIGKK
jgi:5-methyltetrahydrofolate--homocysteine methyltransferase